MYSQHAVDAAMASRKKHKTRLKNTARRAAPSRRRPRPRRAARAYPMDRSRARAASARRFRRSRRTRRRASRGARRRPWAGASFRARPPWRAAPSSPPALAPLAPGTARAPRPRPAASSPRRRRPTPHRHPHQNRRRRRPVSQQPCAAPPPCRAACAAPFGLRRASPASRSFSYERARRLKWRRPTSLIPRARRLCQYRRASPFVQSTHSTRQL